MSQDEIDYDPDFLDEEPIAVSPKAPATKARALVVEGDPHLTRICTESLSRLGIDAEVVWTRDEALAALSRTGDALAFVYADSRLVATTSGDALSALRESRPTTPFVVGSSSIADVLLGDGVVLAKPFDAEQFQAAFDSSLFDEERRRLLLDAAEIVRAIDAAEDLAPAAAAAVPASEPVPSPEMALPLSLSA